VNFKTLSYEFPTRVDSSGPKQKRHHAMLNTECEGGQYLAL